MFMNSYKFGADVSLIERGNKTCVTIHSWIHKKEENEEKMSLIT